VSSRLEPIHDVFRIILLLLLLFFFLDKTRGGGFTVITEKTRCDRCRWGGGTGKIRVLDVATRRRRRNNSSSSAHGRLRRGRRAGGLRRMGVACQSFGRRRPSSTTLGKNKKNSS